MIEPVILGGGGLRRSCWVCFVVIFFFSFLALQIVTTL